MTVANLLHGWSFDKETLPKHLGLEELPGDDELLDYLLEIDIREYGLPVLVDIQSSMKNLPRDLVLQVKKFKNICVPESSLNSEMFDATSKAILRYYLTDGHTTISAVALDSDIKLRKGTKVLFHKHCSMETGFIMMNTKYFTVLGGGIKEVEKKTQIVDGEESKILRSAPKFADLMKSMAKNLSMSRSEPRTENVGSSKQPSQTVQEVDPVSEPKHNARRDVPSGGKPPKEKNRLPKSFGDDSRQQSRGSRSGPAKGRGEFRFNTNDQKPQRMVYEDYEHDIGQSLTFTRSSGNAGGSSVCRAEARRGQDRRPRTEPREQRDNRMEHRNNRNEERGQHSSSGRGRGSSGGRGGNRGGRGGSGSGPSRGRGGGQRMQGGGSYGRTYSPAQPQFNTMNELDFPSLGDAVFGMHLH